MLRASPPCHRPLSFSSAACSPESIYLSKDCAIYRTASASGASKCLGCRQHARAGLATGGGAAANTPPATPAAKAAPGSSATYLEYVKPIIEAYSEAVALGSKRVLHALPRLLTALLEFGSDAVLVRAAAKKSPRPPMLDTLTAAMRKQTDRVCIARPSGPYS